MVKRIFLAMRIYFSMNHFINVILWIRLGLWLLYFKYFFRIMPHCPKLATVSTAKIAWQRKFDTTVYEIHFSIKNLTDLPKALRLHVFFCRKYTLLFNVRSHGEMSSFEKPPPIFDDVICVVSLNPTWHSHWCPPGVLTHIWSQFPLDSWHSSLSLHVFQSEAKE